MRRHIKIALAGLAVAMLGACSLPVRYVTNQNTTPDNNGFYITYWEGDCGGIGGGCSKGNSHVLRCAVAADNSATCAPEAAADAALATPGE